jgi:hypothetical protein
LVLTVQGLEKEKYNENERESEKSKSINDGVCQSMSIFFMPAGNCKMKKKQNKKIKIKNKIK